VAPALDEFSALGEFSVLDWASGSKLEKAFQ
jgi:hypothetical protein